MVASVKQVGFWTPISFGAARNESCRYRAIEFVDNYLPSRGRGQARVFSGSHPEFVTKVKRAPAGKTGCSETARKIVKVLSYLVFGLPMLLAKFVLRCGLKFVVFDPTNPVFWLAQKPQTLTNAEMQSLMIGEYGESDLDQFKDSVFSWEEIDTINNIYRVKRHPLPADSIEFNKTYFMTVDQVRPLKITRSGESDLRRFADSEFLFDGSGNSYTVTRIRKIPYGERTPITEQEHKLLRDHLASTERANVKCWYTAVFYYYEQWREYWVDRGRNSA